VCARRDAGGVARRARAGARGAGRGRGVLRSTRPIGQGLARVQRVGEAWRGSGRRRRAHGWAARSAPEEEERKREERREEKRKEGKENKKEGRSKKRKRKGRAPAGIAATTAAGRARAPVGRHAVENAERGAQGDGTGIGTGVGDVSPEKIFRKKKRTELDDAQIILKPILARDLI